MSVAPVHRVRCAIYTRKSSDDGLEQDFNSLDAQREACAAYVRSQASEGWLLLSGVYDDGGISGSTLERPALKRLLADIAAGQVDTIVVYKVDRLTRSLLDFSKLVEAFDRAGASFVSITQSFNTTTSMGRLTLNMLLSFAQFEREVTAERIRDKIAASKAKGMWMGGTPPLGYAPDGRSLRIVEDHAALIRDIFARYLDLGNVRLVEQALQREGIGTPVRTMTTTGRTFGGVPFGRGQLYTILRCPTYVGEIHHRGQVHAALHSPIIDRSTWDRVQTLLAGNRQGEQRRTRATSPSFLAGLVHDADGAPLVATHATKGAARYRYYVSHALHHKQSEHGLRIPAKELEVAVATCVAALFADPIAVIATAWLAVTPADIARITERCAELHRAIMSRTHDTIRQIVTSVIIHSDRIEVHLGTAAIADVLKVALAAGTPASIMLTTAVELTRSGRAVRLVQPNGSTPTNTVDGSAIRLLIKARGWWPQLRTGEIEIKELAKREGVNASYVTRVLRLAFLAPDVIEAIVAGTLRAGVDGAALTATDAIAAEWGEQRRALLPG